MKQLAVITTTILVWHDQAQHGTEVIDMSVIIENLDELMREKKATNQALANVAGVALSSVMWARLEKPVMEITRDCIVEALEKHTFEYKTTPAPRVKKPKYLTCPTCQKRHVRTASWRGGDFCSMDCYRSIIFPKLGVKLESILECAAMGMTVRDTATELGAGYSQMLRVVRRLGIKGKFPAYGGAATWVARRGYAL